MYIFSSNLFSFDKATKTVVCEISSLDANGYSFEDLIIDIKSERTGNIASFRFVRIERDGTPDNEAQAWIYASVSTHLSGWTLHILND